MDDQLVIDVTPVIDKMLNDKNTLDKLIAKYKEQYKKLLNVYGSDEDKSISTYVCLMFLCDSYKTNTFMLHESIYKLENFYLCG